MWWIRAARIHSFDLFQNPISGCVEVLESIISERKAYQGTAVDDETMGAVARWLEVDRRWDPRETGKWARVDSSHVNVGIFHFVLFATSRHVQRAFERNHNSAADTDNDVSIIQFQSIPFMPRFVEFKWYLSRSYRDSNP